MASLNPDQINAVHAYEPAVLVLSGAGTGKTRVIVEHIIWLINEKGISPEQILAVTFTNKSAGEMKKRVLARINQTEKQPWVGTFHSFGLQFLRKYASYINLKNNFILIDDDDQISHLKKILKSDPILLEQFTPREAQVWISRYKQNISEPKDSPITPPNSHFLKLWDIYQDTLQSQGMVDFDDLISLPVKILEEHSTIRERMHYHFTDILVDEFQDTNHAQFRLVQALKGSHNRVFVVGDEDQCIYSWRGSDLNNILNFPKIFPDTTIYRLEQNYRSTKNILLLANKLVEHNENRLGKKLWTQNDEGDKIKFYWATTDEEEAEWIANDIQKNQYPLEEVAILFRTNHQSRPFEEAFRKRGIPHIVIGGIRFYARKEIKDIVAYLRLLTNEEDDDAFRRIINVPHRNLGQVSLQQMEVYAKQKQKPLFHVLRFIEHDETFPMRTRKSIKEFVDLIDEIKLVSKEKTIGDTVKYLLEKTNYWEYINNIAEKEGKDREKSIQEFITICEQNSMKEKSLLEFLQEFALLSDIDTQQPQKNAVHLLTCHSAKGLEFNYVYLTGLEEGLFPYLDEDDPYADIEEERRLCYVAMTRARKRLILSGAASRLYYGRVIPDRLMSRFLFEIDLQNVEVYGIKKNVENNKTIHLPDKKMLPTKEEKKREYRLGTKVRHAKFGYGVVLNTEGSGDKMRVRVRFDSGKIAVLLINMAPMEIIKRKKN
ncbi:MAG TPA: 3'-5' exonuclease [Candidatus Hydrogenedens sp.]|nr:3'-5' exonuclease [Candidatus Hydrogenedens sp.]